MGKLKDVRDRVLAAFAGIEEEEDDRTSLAGDAKEIEWAVARPGKFKDMTGRVVNVTSDMLSALASSLNLDRHRPKVTKGHGPHATDVPAFGAVTGLRWDGNFLFAKVKPTPELVSDVNAGRFTEKSIEFTEKPPRFLGLAMLGARDPAIDWLPAASFSKEISEGSVYLLATEDMEVPEDPAAFAISAAERKKIASDDFAGPNETFPIRSQGDVTHAAQLLHHAADPAAVKRKIVSIAKRKGLTLPDTWKESNSDRVAAAAPEGSTMTPEEEARIRKENEDAKAALAKARDREKRIALADVDRFVESDPVKKRVGLKGLRPLKALLAALATAEVEGTTGVVKFAEAEGKEEKETSLYDLAKFAVGSMREKLTEEEQTEDDRRGTEGKEGVFFADVQGETDIEGDEYTRLAQAEQDAAAAKGEKISFREAASRAYAKHGGRLRLVQGGASE